MQQDITKLIRKNILSLMPYTTARHEFTGTASIYLDANENTFGSGISLQLEDHTVLDFNRYPDPNQTILKTKLSTIKGVPPKNIFLGNGSDEAIDLVLRIFCEPGIDNCIICPPTYGMYKVSASINNIDALEVPLTEDFQLDINALLMHITANTKVIFICSPNNPTGNSMHHSDIEFLLNNFDGIVVLDEAYINYSKQKTLIPLLTKYSNLIILQTLSKAWGLAGLRLGMAFASASIIDFMNKVKYPYNINTATQRLAIKALDNLAKINTWIKAVIQEREKLVKALLENNLCTKVYSSDANFILVKFEQAKALYDYLCSKAIIVRDRSSIQLCENCLRITIGIPLENKDLLTCISEFQNQKITK